MLYPKIERCVERLGSKYTVAIIAAKRGKDLVAKKPAAFADSKTKELTYALYEIFDGKIVPAVTN